MPLHVVTTYTTVTAYRPGSVDAHLVAQFYSQDSNLDSELQQTLNDAISSGQMSAQVLDNLLPLPIDSRGSELFAYGVTSRNTCERGQRFNYEDAQCEDCPLGYYQMAELVDVCLACDAGYSTEGTAQIGTEEEACRCKYMYDVTINSANTREQYNLYKALSKH